MPVELTRSFLDKVVRSSGWALSEVESLSLEGESISCLGDSFAGMERLVYLSLARNNISSLLGVEHLSSLSTAILSANRVSSMGEVGRLGRLPNLRNLDLRLNPIMADPQTGGGSSGSGSSRTVGGGGGGIRHGVYSQHDARAASRGRQEQEDFFTRNPREIVLKALPQLVNLDGQKVEDSERRELRRRSAAAKPSSETSANPHEETVASARETRRIERRTEEATDNLQRYSWPRRDNEVTYGATDAVALASRASAGGERARSGFEGEVVGATRSYDEQDLRRAGTAPCRGRAVAGRYADAGVRKRDRTGTGVLESGGRDEGLPSLRAASSGSGGSRAVEVTRSWQCPVNTRSAAGSQGGRVPPGAASATANDDDLAALWSELGEGFLEFEQPRAAAVATVVAGRNGSPSRSQCVPGCRRCGCSGGACECQDPLHSPPRGASGYTQLFAAELDESTSAVSFPGASRQIRYGPRAIDQRLFSDPGIRTTEPAGRRNVVGGEGDRRIQGESYADEWDSLGRFDVDARRSGGGGGDSNNCDGYDRGSNSFKGSSGSSRDDTNPALLVSSSLVSVVPRKSSSNHGSNQRAASLVSTAPRRSDSSHSGNQGSTAIVARNPDPSSDRRSTTNIVLAAGAKAVVNPANRGNGGGEQREARSRRHPPAHTVSARDTVGCQNPGSAAAPGSISEPSLPYSQRRQIPGSVATPGPLSESPLLFQQPVPPPTDNAANSVVVVDSTPPSLYSQPVPAPTDNAASTVVVVAGSTPPAQSGSSSKSTTTAAARAVEAFRRSSQRLGLVDASKTGSSSPATSHAGSGVAAGGCHGNAPGGPASYQADGGVAAEGSARGGPAGSGGIDYGSPGPTSSVEVNAELDTKLKGACVGGGTKASEDGCGADYTDKASAIGVASSTATTERAVSETETSTALVVSPATETAVSSKMAVSSETVGLFSTGGAVKCKECGANYGKGSKKPPGATAASASRVAAVSGVAPAAGGGELHERWWTREKEFASRWAEREREFDARWTAREREFDKRRREESKEFTRGMRAMLFEAHNALIASNAWLLERLQAVETVRESPPAAETDPNISATPRGGSTANSVGASGTGPLCPPLPRRAANFVPDTPPTLFAEADREGQRRQRQNRVLIPGNPIGAPSLNSSGGATATREEGLPIAATARAGAPPDIRGGSERGAGGRRGGAGGRFNQAPGLEDEKGRRQRGKPGRVYRDGEALQHTERGEAGRVYRDAEALERVVGDARKSPPLVRGSDIDPDVVAPAFARLKPTDIEPRETRELPNGASELSTGVDASSDVGARYRETVAGGHHDVPPTPGSVTSQHLEETATDAQGVMDDRPDLEPLVNVNDSAGAGRRKELKVRGSSVVAAAATSMKVATSSRSTAAAAACINSSGSYFGGVGRGGGGEASEGNFDASVAQFLGGCDRRTDGKGSLEQVSAFASAHVQGPAESERRVARLGEGDANRVLDGEPDERSDGGGQKGAIVGGGVEVGVSGGGNGTTVLGPSTVLGQNMSVFDQRNEADAVWRRGRGVGGSGAGCPDPEVTTSAPDG